MNETHDAVVLVKQGSAWTNDFGETFPPQPLYRSTCACGWEGLAWYGSEKRALEHFMRHVQAVTVAA